MPRHREGENNPYLNDLVILYKAVDAASDNIALEAARALLEDQIMFESFERRGQRAEAILLGLKLKANVRDIQSETQLKEYSIEVGRHFLDAERVSIARKGLIAGETVRLDGNEISKISIPDLFLYKTGPIGIERVYVTGRGNLPKDLPFPQQLFLPK